MLSTAKVLVFQEMGKLFVFVRIDDKLCIFVPFNKPYKPCYK